MNWNSLNMSQKNELMQIYLKNGITSLDEMKKHYNSFAEGGSIDDPPKNINVTTPLFSIQGTLPEDSDLEDRYKANDIAKGIEYAGNYFGSEGFKNRAIKANQKYGYNLYNPDDPLCIQHFPKRINFIQNSSNANAAFNFGLSLYENPIFAGGHETGHHIPLYNTHTFGLSDDIKTQMANPNSTLYSPRYHNDYSQIPEEWRNILRPINPEDDHNAELSEAYSDLVGLRAVLKDYGIFDSDDPNAVFTQEMLNEFKKQLGSKTNRFLDYHSDENVIRAVNEIADAGQSSIGNYAAKGGKLDIPPYTQFLNTLPDNLKNSGNEYNMRRYWELNNYPKDFNEGIQLGMFAKQDDGYHANSVAFNPVTNSYEFMKNRNHPTYNMELDWYYSDDPEAVEFRKKYKYTPGVGMIPDQYIPIYREGGRIYIKPENRGKFTALKKRTGHSAS